MRYAVCPQSPGNLWWQGYGVKHLKGVSNPVKRFATSKGARNYAKKKAMDYEYGLVVVDWPAPPRVREGPPLLYEHCGLVALKYPDYVEIVECNPKVPKRD